MAELMTKHSNVYENGRFFFHDLGDKPHDVSPLIKKC